MKDRKKGKLFFMVKMVLGSSDTQASSVGTLVDNYKSGFEKLVSAIDQLTNEDRLSGSAYTNVKTYGSSVVAPLDKPLFYWQRQLRLI